jgi:hypothetical protein
MILGHLERFVEAAQGLMDLAAGEDAEAPRMG